MNYFDNTEMIDAIRAVKMKIYNYKETIRITSCPIYRLRLEAEVVEDLEYVLNLLEELNRDLEVNYTNNPVRLTKEFTADELSTFDGSEGRPAYVVINGIVYDVGLEATWGGASHFGLKAGKDLTAQFNSCHGKAAVLSKLSKVGVLSKGGGQLNERK